MAGALPLTVQPPSRFTILFPQHHAWSSPMMHWLPSSRHGAVPLRRCPERRRRLIDCRDEMNVWPWAIRQRESQLCPARGEIVPDTRSMI